MKIIKAIPKAQFDYLLSEPDYMLKRLDYACFISILDVDNKECKYDLSTPNFLQVRMWDIEVDIVGDRGIKYDKPSDIELQKIVDFVNSNVDKEVFVVHCSAGISRSGAVAEYIKRKFFEEVDSEKFYIENKFIQPNLYILKRLYELDGSENLKQDYYDNN